MITPILISAPALEPLTLAEAKLWLRVDTADEDDSIARLITAARLIVEAESGLKLIDQTWRLVMDQLPASLCIRVPLNPFKAVSAARVIDANGAAAVVVPAAYAADTASVPGRIIVQSTFPPPGRAFAGIEFDILAGHGAAAAAVPAPLRQAMLLLITRWFEQRGEAGAAEAGAMPPEIALLLSNYRRWRL